MAALPACLRAAAALQANKLHLDVKSGNVLLASDMTAKVADVGLARTLTSCPASKVGTFDWASPEMLLAGRCSKASDVFSFGEHVPGCSGKPVAEAAVFMCLLPVKVATKLMRLQEFCCGSWHQLSGPCGGS